MSEGEPIDEMREIVNFNREWVNNNRRAPFTEVQLDYLGEWLAQSLSTLVYDMRRRAKE